MPVPWAFSLLILPLGMIVGLNYIALPFLLAIAGLSVDRIATMFGIVAMITRGMGLRSVPDASVLESDSSR